MTTITVYDGATTIGGNKIYIEENGRGVFLDFGMNFAKYSEFFEEFLTERNGRGIHDLVHLNLIPKLNIYRSDLIPSDLDVASYPKLNVEAVLLSHAHLDHCGNVGLLRETIPIVASPTSVAILKALRDTSQSRIGLEIAYMSPKIPIEGGIVLKSDQSKKVPYIGRDFYCTFEPSEKLVEFMFEKPGQSSRTKQLEPGKLCHVDELNLPFEIKAYEVDHSIYGACAYILYGDTAIAYTGDFRLHGKNADKTREFVKEGKDATVLVIEGTRAEREDVNESEEIVFQNCLKAVEDSDKLVIADFSPRNFERLETFVEIAEKTGRQLVVTAKDIYMLYAIECADGVCRMDKTLFYYELKDRSRAKYETEVIMGELDKESVTHKQISKNPEKYILCFSFYDMKHLLDIKPDGGTYIYSSSEAFTEEQVFDFLRLWKWLDFFKFRIYGFKIVAEGGELRPDFVKGYHASGHASKSDLEWVIDEIDPDKVIPVHTTNHEWFVENFENVVVAEEGRRIDV